LTPDRLLPVAHGLHRGAEVAEGAHFAARVVGVGRDVQVELVELPGVAEVADAEVNVAEAGRSLGFGRSIVRIPAESLAVRK
jgi:hypothetical protein